MTDPLRRAAILAVQSAVAAVLACQEEAAHPPPAAEEPLDEASRIAHLLRRAGFGAGKAELERFRSLGLQGTVEHLLDYTGVPDAALDRLAALELDLTKLDQLQRWWLLRMLHTTRPLQEKMVLFWHGLLVSGNSKVGSPPLMLRQSEFFREHAFDSFPAILKGIGRDPAMMIYLDITGSQKARPNENYARELMELFALGVGNYNEGDVQQGARAFTGWSVNRRDGTVTYNKQQHDDGLKNFLTQTGNFGPDDIVDIIVAHPASSRHLARHLFSFFAYENPPAAALEPLVAAYEANDHSVRAMIETLFTSEEFYSRRAYRAVVKSPVEYVIGALRTLEVETTGEFLPGLVTRMGQALFNPPNVAGWPGGGAWLNSATWFERMNFANRLATARGDKQLAVPDLNQWLEEEDRGAAALAVARILDLLVDGRVTPEAEDILRTYLEGNGSAARPLWRFQDQRSLDERLRGLFYLVLATPEYQLA